MKSRKKNLDGKNDSKKQGAMLNENIEDLSGCRHKRLLKEKEASNSLDNYGLLRRGLAAIPPLEQQLRIELDILRNQERASTYQISHVVQLSNVIIDSITDTSHALNEMVKVINQQVSNDKEAEQLISRALEEADDESRDRIIEQIQSVGGLLSSIEELCNALAVKRIVYSKVAELIDQEHKPRVLLEKLIDIIDPSLITPSDATLTKEELKKKIKNIVDEYETKEQERASKGEPFDIDFYQQYQLFLYDLCWRAFKYRPAHEGGPLSLDSLMGPDPNPGFTQRLTEVLKELGINCPQILGITHYMWWCLFMAAFIIYDIYK